MILYGPVNVVELYREFRKSVVLHCFLWEAAALWVVQHLLERLRVFVSLNSNSGEYNEMNVLSANITLHSFIKN